MLVLIFYQGGSLFFTIKFPQIAGTYFLSTSEGQTTQILKSDSEKGVSVATCQPLGQSKCGKAPMRHG